MGAAGSFWLSLSTSRPPSATLGDKGICPVSVEKKAPPYAEGPSAPPESTLGGLRASPCLSLLGLKMEEGRN